ncbi:D-2-hydroxyacid dehydrogenase [Acidihalobacter ferrooxydans]|uniref:Glycerate dehydrogenase n=1 Tax=Acidihalobacter ferrooxydans TaxID=1765967 RepID=A0A1P8UI03_9GAMM|nr:D-2-hydroxyacid dehydrogenase [Acidihalobacter ferrooxydans]APZ43462.1 glycerate dehydrogenase [Acidihalobacter ferrooxydans]
MHAVFLDLDTVDRGDLDLASLRAQIPDAVFHPYTDDADALARIGHAEIVLLNKVRIDAAVFDHAPSLRCICMAATGTDNVDLAAAEAHGVAVYNVRDYGSQSVGEHVFALLLGLVRKLPDYHHAVQAGHWSESRLPFLLDFPIGELYGKRLAIVGHGVLGTTVARMADCFGMEVIVAERRGVAPRAGRVSFEAALEAADVLSLHCPLTPQTRNLIGTAELDLLGPDGLLINTARGGLVDAQALADALRSGRLGGAGLDVLDAEPPPANNPLLAGDIPNLIITPHVAWASRRARQTVIEQMAAALKAFLHGAEHPNRVV